MYIFKIVIEPQEYDKYLSQIVIYDGKHRCFAY
jgi:hypothetical protein